MYLQHPRPEYTTTVGKCIRLQGDRIGDVCKNSSEVLSETDFFFIFFFTLHCLQGSPPAGFECIDHMHRSRGGSGRVRISVHPRKSFNDLIVTQRPHPGGGGVILVTREKILNPRLHHSKYTSLASSF